jgi:transcriptional regulator with XRE-family HTH domain
MSVLYSRIADLTAQKKMSLAELERNLGFSNGIISTWKKSNPSIDKVEKVANLFHTTTDYLLGRTDDPSIPESNSSITDADLDKMLDNARSFDGKPMTEHDRELIRSYLKGLYDAK